MGNMCANSYEVVEIYDGENGFEGKSLEKATFSGTRQTNVTVMKSNLSCSGMGQLKQNNPEVLPETFQTHLAVKQPYIQPGTSKFNHFCIEQNDNSEILPEINKTTSLMKPNTWSENQTLMFLDLCSENKERLTNVKYKKTEVYKDIAVELQNKGHYFTADQCANRLKTLTAKYKLIRDHNSQSGNSYKDWVFFDSMAEYFGDRPGITPRAVCSSMRLADDAVPASSQTNETITAETTKNSGKKISTDCTRKVKKKYKRNSPRVEMVKWLQEYKKEVSEREERRIALAREQHAENKKIMADILNLMKKDESLDSK